ncbi:methylated-DNA--[protein]-cysteine S-methyltransferase [Colwellia asteriadis]|uniref:Methylated-DNA--protein-cysteine methyltransferase n=1 Tax=Colwellia asteriadis TaxID=517723 RepID=A0ABP3WCW9_9GAMM
MNKLAMYTDYIDTPLGLFEFKASELGITQAIFCGDLPANIINSTVTNSITERCKSQLTEYFAGTRQVFDLPLTPQGTDFQQSVWQCLTQIPFGEHCSYQDIAKKLGKPKASQAVGGANGRNPITLIVPCHRVIGASGALTGYAGGIERKLWLLKHEGVSLNTNVQDKHRDIQHVISTRQAKTDFLN